jgi:hypothetical protein
VVSRRAPWWTGDAVAFGDGSAWWDAGASWTFDVIADDRPVTGWRLNNVGVDPTILISPNMAGGVRFCGHPAGAQCQTSRTQRARCAGCGTPPGPDACGFSAVGAPEDLMEVHAWFERAVRKFNSSGARAFNPLIPKWNPADLSEFGAVSRVAAWGRRVRVEGAISPLAIWRPSWMTEWMRTDEIWVGEPLADYADGLRAAYPGVPVVATLAGLSPLASIVAALAERATASPSSALAQHQPPRPIKVAAAPFHDAENSAGHSYRPDSSPLMITAQVGPHIWTGGHTGTTLDRCADAGFTHVIDCRSEANCLRDVENHPKVGYLWAPTADDGTTKDGSWFEPAVQFALRALQRHPPAKLYVHCYLGLRRGPSMTYAILRAQGHSTEEATAMVLAARPSAQLRYAANADTYLAETRPAPSTKCLLCIASPFTERLHTDEYCWVADCRTCRVPMVVWNSHGVDVPVGVPSRMLTALHRVAQTRFPAGFEIDQRMRSIPDHWHAHARPTVTVGGKVDDRQPVHGWRYWKDIVTKSGQLALPSPLHPMGRATFCATRDFDAERCRRGCSATPGPNCSCGRFAYTTLEDLSAAHSHVPILTAVSGFGTVRWSATDSAVGPTGAWRAQRIRINALFVPAGHPLAARLGRQLDVPVVELHKLHRSAWLDNPAIDAWPNVRRAVLTGRLPESA